MVLHILLLDSIGVGIIALIIILGTMFLVAISPTPKTIMKHWYHYFEGMQFSSDDVYALMAEEVKNRQLPKVHSAGGRYLEEGIFSARRATLCFSFKEFSIDICCAPYGNGYYISWWLLEEEPGLISKIPLINTLVGKNPKYKSYYQIDTGNLFQSAIHDAIMTVIDGIANEKGMRKLSELERQPKSGYQ